MLDRLGESSDTLYLVDISSFIFRAFFAIRPLTTPSGEPANAVYGVASMLARLNDEAKPRYLAVVYDSKEPSFRKELYAEYKANRSAPPEDLVPQFGRIEELVKCLGMPSYRKPGVGVTQGKLSRSAASVQLPLRIANPNVQMSWSCGASSWIVVQRLKPTLFSPLGRMSTGL